MGQTVGIIAEFDPFHRGHEYLIRTVRQRCPEAAVVAAMSGHFTQRGTPAALRPHARAEMALGCGADLVLELPLPWAISSAEGFGRGGVEVLAAAGADTLAFGSESNRPELLKAAADCLLRPDFPASLKGQLKSGQPFAAARQGAVAELAGEEAAAVLSTPNDTLGVSYLAAAHSLGREPEILTVPRTGAAHDAAGVVDGTASASHIRSLLRAGAIGEAAALLPAACRPILYREQGMGLTCAGLEHCQRGVLYRLRMMQEGDFLALPDCSEGLEHRLYRAARQAASVEEFYALAKTKRYAHARIRRLLLWAFLGMTAADRPRSVPYLRVLGMNSRGQQVLHRIKKTCPVPILTKPAAARRMTEEARTLFALEQRAGDLWRLCLPGLERSAGGQGWTENLVILREPGMDF